MPKIRLILRRLREEFVPFRGENVMSNLGLEGGIADLLEWAL